jgi:hypothetical protein
MELFFFEAKVKARDSTPIRIFTDLWDVSLLLYE